MTATRATAAAILLAMTLLGATSVEETVEAEAGLAAAERRLAAIEADLDRVAAAYETAAAHAVRLANEVGRNDWAVQVAQDRHDDAQAAVRAAVRARYMTPPLEQLWVIRAWTAAPGVASALHRSALLDMLPDVMAERAASAEATSVRLANQERQLQLVTAGASSAQRDLDQAKARLTDEVAEASEEVAEARETLEDLRRRAAAEAAVAGSPTAVAGGTGWNPPPVMACPLGLPNGFSPSWGAARPGGRSHQGVDMFAGRGMPVFAAAAGTVRVGSNGLGGLTVDLYDTTGNRYYYAHLDSVAVTSGQTVAAGQTVGGAGTSGNAAGTPPHLHWQVHPGGGGPTDPYPIASALCRP